MDPDRWEFILHCGQQDTSKPIRNISDDALHVSSTHGAQTVDLRVASERLAGGERWAHGVYVRKGEDFSSVYVDTHTVVRHWANLRALVSWGLSWSLFHRVVIRITWEKHRF